MLGLKFVKFLVSILNWQFNSPSNFVTLFLFMTHNFPENFKLIHLLLWIEASHQNLNFETSKFSGENLTNSSCHFLKHRSVFLQILCQFGVSLNISLFYFFSSNILYFGQKQPIKGQIFEIFECSDQNSSNSSCQFWTDKSISLQILNHSSLPWYITFLKILSSYIFDFG